DDDQPTTQNLPWSEPVQYAPRGQTRVRPRSDPGLTPLRPRSDPRRTPVGEGIRTPQSSIRRLTLKGRLSEPQVQGMEDEPFARLAGRVNAITRPAVVLRCCDDSSFDRIRFHIPQAVQPVPLFLDRLRAVSI